MYIRLMAAIFDLSVHLTSESVHVSPTVLLDPENVQVVVGFSLLSYLQAEKYDMANVLPVNGGHVQFTAHLDVGEYPSIHICPTVFLDPEIVGVAVGISLLSYIQAEIYDMAYVLPDSGGHV